MAKLTLSRRCLIASTAASAALFAVPGMSLATDYDADVEAAIATYASKGSLAGVTLNAIWRHLPNMDFIAKYTPKFERYTGVKIHFTDYGENLLRAKEVAESANKSGGFQLFTVDDDYMPMFAENGWVQSLNGIIKPAYKLDDLFEGLADLYSWKGKLYGLPMYTEVTLLYYRKDLFKRYGLSVPQTMAEFAANAAELTHPPRLFGTALRGLRGDGMNVYTWSEWLRSYGGNFLDPHMNPVFNSPEGITATEHYAELIRKYAPPGAGAWGWPQIASGFAAGRIAMIVEASAFYPMFNDPKQSSIVGKIGYAMVPAGPKGRFPANFSLGLAIPATVARGSKTFEAASAFMQWATSQPMEMAWTASGVTSENRNSVQNSALLRSRADLEFLKVVTEEQKITKHEYRPFIPQWREMGDILGAQLEDVFTGTKSAKAALDAAAVEVTTRFKAQGVLGTERPYKEIFPDS